MTGQLSTQEREKGNPQSGEKTFEIQIYNKGLYLEYIGNSYTLIYKEDPNRNE